MQQHRAHPTRPAAVVLSALLALLTFLLPVSAKSAPASRPSSTGTAATGTAATVAAQVSATAGAQRPVAVAHRVLGRADAVPYPFHGFLGPGAGDAAPHRAVGGPTVAVAVAGAGVGWDGHAYRPRGPPSRWSTEVRIDA